MRRNRWYAQVLAWANRIAASATSTAPLHNAMRRFHWCGAKTSCPSRAWRRGLEVGICPLSQTPQGALHVAGSESTLQRLWPPAHLVQVEASVLEVGHRAGVARAGQALQPQ